MSEPPPEPQPRLSRSRIMGVTLLAEAVGAVVIVAVLPLAWATRVVLVAVWLTVAHVVSRVLLRRAEDG